MPTNKQLSLYLSLFRGRQDVFARFWERNGRSGYSPAYAIDWDKYRTHQARGGTMKTFENKTAVPLTKDIVQQHLAGTMPQLLSKNNLATRNSSKLKLSPRASRTGARRISPVFCRIFSNTHIIFAQRSDFGLM